MSIRVPSIGDRVTVTGIVLSVDDEIIVIDYDTIQDHGVPNPEYDREAKSDNA
jgi:hypothetical protein